MGIALDIKLDPKNPNKFYAQALQEGMPKAMLTQTNKALSVTEREVKKSIRRKFKGGSELAGSYSRKFELVGKFEIKAGVLSQLVYARVQDLGTKDLPGGAIRAKPPLKRLAIPLLDDLRAAGIWPRHNPRVMDVIVTTSRRTGRKQVLLVDAMSGVPMYLLVEETRFSGKFYIDAAIKAATPQVDKIYGDVFPVAIERFGGKL